MALRQLYLRFTSIEEVFLNTCTLVVQINHLYKNGEDGGINQWQDQGENNQRSKGNIIESLYC